MPKRPIIPTKLIKEDVTDQFIYSGLSMHPTFKPGQLLYIRPTMNGLSVGDVIVYSDHNQKINVVHRVVKIKDGLVYTRGDNNPYNDVNPIHPKDILGVVVKVNQNGSIASVQGGKAGYRRLQHQAKRNRIAHFLKSLLFPFYRNIKASGIVPKIWHPEIKKIHLETQNGFVIKYVSRNRTVAQWDSVSKRFTYQHPYDLLITPPDQCQDQLR